MMRNKLIETQLDT